MEDISPFSQRFHLNFSINSFILKKVRLYQLIITEYPRYQVFSFFFRYNSLKLIHTNATNKQDLLYPEVHFPSKLCYCNRKNDRSKDFKDFFTHFSSIINDTELFFREFGNRQ